MQQPFDTIIAGAGLAGVAAALHLSRSQRVLLIEAEQPAARASGAAAGLVNPLMGRRPRLVWRAPEALDALEATLDLANASELFRKGDVLRPASTDRHARHYHRTASEHPDYAEWLDAETAAANYPQVNIEAGALRMHRGGAIDVSRMVNALVDAARRRGAQLRTNTEVTGWREEAGYVYVDARQAERHVHFGARHLILAFGAGYTRHAELADLSLQRIKGQTVRVQRPPNLDRLPFLIGSGYVIPDKDTLIVGSTYEYDFHDLKPSAEQTQYILQKVAHMLPPVAEAAVIGARAGARVKVPNSRYPMLGLLPNRHRTWVFTALGSKGLLTGPLLARRLPDYLADPETVPEEVRVRTT